jgi:hypothetical protein
MKTMQEIQNSEVYIMQNVIIIQKANLDKSSFDLLHFSILIRKPYGELLIINQK